MPFRMTLGNPRPGAKPFSPREYTRDLSGKTKICLGNEVTLPDRVGYVNAGRVAKLWGLQSDPEVLLLEKGDKLPDGFWDVFTVDSDGSPEQLVLGEREPFAPVEESPVGPVPETEGEWPPEISGHGFAEAPGSPQEAREEAQAMVVAAGPTEAPTEAVAKPEGPVVTTGRRGRKGRT